MQKIVDEINALEPEMKKLKDEDFPEKTEEFRKRLGVESPTSPQSLGSNVASNFAKASKDRSTGSLSVAPTSTSETDKKKGNLEEQMRDFRYKKFEEVRKKEKLDWIAVGHTLDDQAETFFMNLIRGSGIKGLGAVSEKRDRIIRPLIETEKKEILKYLKEKGQDYRTDKSNLDRKLLRNRIRLDLIPYLEKNYHPQIKRRVSDLSWQVRDVNDFVEEIAEKKYNGVVASRKKDKLEIYLEKYQRLEPVFKGIVFRTAIRELKGNERDLTRANFFEFEKMIESKKDKQQKMKIRKIEIERGTAVVIFKKV